MAYIKKPKSYFKKYQHGNEECYRYGCRCELCAALHSKKRGCPKRKFTDEFLKSLHERVLSGETYRKIAKEMGLSHERIRQLIPNAAKERIANNRKRHGIALNYYYGCRCDLCRKAFYEKWNKKYRK